MNIFCQSRDLSDRTVDNGFAYIYKIWLNSDCDDNDDEHDDGIEEMEMDRR